MTVKIDGTNTVANPAFTGADTDTGLQVGTNEVKLVTGGTARATVDSSGNVGVGTTSPGVLVDAAGSNPTLRVRATTTNTEVSTLRITEDNNYVGAYVKYDGSTNLTHIGTHSAADSNTANDNNAITIVRDNRNVGIGTTSVSQPLHLARSGGSTILELQRTDSNTSGTVGAISFTANDGHSVAAINAAGDGDNEGAHLIFRTTSAASANSYFTSTTERMRILSSGGLTFNGDTAQANALDDYEEGDWTPTIVGSSITYTNQVGRYTKIGNIVHIHAAVQIAGGTVSSSFSILSGLPFTTRSSDYNKMTIATNGGNWNGGAVPVAQVQPNATTIAAIGITNNAGFNNINAQHIWDAVGNWLEIAGFYYVS